jgi:hypothetical protein
MKFDYITDPGHGWLKVPRHLVQSLDIAGRITPYSYERGAWVYLEEDLDMGTFIDEYRARGGIVNIRQRNCRERVSRVRSYDHYRGQA